MIEQPTDGFIISREEFADLTRLYAARINSKNVGRIPAIFNSIRSHPYQSGQFTQDELEDLFIIVDSNVERCGEDTKTRRLLDKIQELRQTGEQE